MKRALITILLLAFARLTSAQSATSDIPLPVPGNGIITPRSVAYVPIDPLVKTVMYAIQCKLSNLTNVPINVSFQIQSGHYGVRGYDYLNGNPLNVDMYGYAHAVLPPGVNNFQSASLEIFNSSGNNLAFFNDDDTQAVQISDCIAHFTTSKLENTK